MSSTPNQILRCTGELRIDNGGEINKELRGTLRFVDNNTTYGQLRVYGIAGFGEMVLDTVNVSQGFNVRTQTIQGGSYMGGSNEPYPFQVINLQTKVRNLQVADYKSQYNQQTGQNLFLVQRSSTVDSYSTTQKDFTIGGFSQQQFKVGEGVFQYTGCIDGFSSWFGFRSVDGSGFSTANYGVMGVAYNSTLAEAIYMKSDGSVECPVKISAPVIEGTSIVGVDFLPLTLKKTEGYVGINKLNPTQALDVIGNVQADGYYIAGRQIGTGAGATSVMWGSTSTAAAGGSSIAIGNSAGNTGQGTYGIAIGILAGNSAQSSLGIAIGNQAGKTTQGGSSIAIGGSAGLTTQGIGCVAIGTNAGSTSQGNYSIAVGFNAGQTTTTSKSIILNASGTAVNSTTASCYIAPIRLYTAPTNYLTYDPTTYEITYKPLTPLTLDATNNRIGINTGTPSQSLDLVGSAQITPATVRGADSLLYMRGCFDIPGNPDITPRLCGMVKTGFDTAWGTEYMIFGVGEAGDTPVDPVERFRIGINYCRIANNLTVAGALGINNLTPSESLDVNGSIKCADTVKTSYVGPLTGEKTIQLTSTGTTLTTDVTVNTKLTATTIEATNYIGIPSQNLSPLTLFENARVGINKVSPLEALDVVGSVNCSVMYKQNGRTLLYPLDLNPTIPSTITPAGHIIKTFTMQKGQYLMECRWGFDAPLAETTDYIEVSWAPSSATLYYDWAVNVSGWYYHRIYGNGQNTCLPPFLITTTVALTNETWYLRIRSNKDVYLGLPNALFRSTLINGYV